MSWDGIRDERIMDTDTLLYEQECHDRNGANKRLFDHIDATNHICRYVRDLLMETWKEDMEVGDKGWSAVVAAAVLLDENFTDPEEATP